MESPQTRLGLTPGRCSVFLILKSSLPGLFEATPPRGLPRVARGQGTSPPVLFARSKSCSSPQIEYPLFLAISRKYDRSDHGPTNLGVPGSPEPGNQRRRGIFRESVDQLEEGWGVKTLGDGATLGVGNNIILVKIPHDIISFFRCQAALSAALRPACNVKRDKT